MISYYDGQLTDILPGNIAGRPEVQALSYALQQACRLLCRYSQRVCIYASLDSQPEEVIDLLAAELRTQYYQGALDIDAKRRLVKNTLIWHMGAGTPEAVEELVAAVFGEGRVKEWFEYGDEPYYFKIETSALLEPEMHRLFATMVRQVKNTRSHLRAVDVYRIVNQELFAGIGMSQRYRPPAIIDGYTAERTTGQKMYFGAGIRQAIYPEAVMEQP